MAPCLLGHDKNPKMMTSFIFLLLRPSGCMFDTPHRVCFPLKSNVSLFFFISVLMQGASASEWIWDVCVRSLSWCICGPLHHTPQPHITGSAAPHLLCR